jgi:hypothetical protein
VIACRRVFAVAVLALALSACAGLRFGDAAALRIDCAVPEAAVFIDDTFMGRAHEWNRDGRFVKPGFHRIAVLHPDYYEHYAELQLAKGDAVLLQVSLYRLLD